MSLCVLAAGKTSVFAASLFTLSWEHSVERTEWQEEWRVTPAGLELVEARIKGSGAGMEPPDGAILKDGWWIYTPDLPPQAGLALAASGETRSGWRLCAGEDCVMLGEAAAEPVLVRPCER